jgi:glycosyltransferase involved in cell wall biosynthesis
MRLMIVSHFLPFPALSGGKTRLFNLLKMLCVSNEVQFVHIDYDGKEDIELSKKEFPGVIFKSVSDGLGYKRLPYYIFSLIGLGGLFVSQKIKRFIAQEIFSFNPDNVQFEFSQSAKFLPKGVKNSFLVIHELRWVRMFREADYLNGVRYVVRKISAWLVKREELMMFKKFKTLICVSDKDKEAVKAFLPSKKIVSIPNGVDLETYRFHSLPPDGIKGVYFVGWFGNKQNIEALDFLLTKIATRLPSGMSIKIFGLDLPKELEKKISSIGGRYYGYVNEEDFSLEVAGFILVAPLFSGSGTRLKIIEALARGNPVISSAIGAEGIDADDGECLMICSKVDDYIGAIKKLTTNRDFCVNLINKGRLLVEKNYDWVSIGLKNEKIYE